MGANDVDMWGNDFCPSWNSDPYDPDQEEIKRLQHFTAYLEQKFYIHCGTAGGLS